MGQAEGKLADQMATEAMRTVMDSVPMGGTIVIGEGERDEAPGARHRRERSANTTAATYPSVDIAVDPLKEPIWRALGSPGCDHGAGRFRTWRARYMPPTATWRRSSSAPRARASSTWKRRSITISVVIAKVRATEGGRSGDCHSRATASREADRRRAQSGRAHSPDFLRLPSRRASPPAMLGSGVHAVMGFRRRSGRRNHRSGHSLPQRLMVGRPTGYTPEQAERMKDMGISYDDDTVQELL